MPIRLFNNPFHSTSPIPQHYRRIGRRYGHLRLDYVDDADLASLTCSCDKPFKIPLRDLITDTITDCGCRGAHHSTIYFLRVHNRVKIGYCKERALSERISDLQTGCPYPLELIHTIHGGGKRIESLLHKIFASLRIDREWFHYSPEMQTMDLPTIDLFSKEPTPCP